MRIGGAEGRWVGIGEDGGRCADKGGGNREGLFCRKF